MAKRRSAAKATLGAGILFSLVGLIFFFVCLFLTIDTKEFAETAQETTAVITDVEKTRVRRNGKYRTDYDVYVQYEVDGSTYNEELNGASSSMREGQMITVYYDPENPAEARAVDYTGGSDNFVPISAVLIASGMVFAVASCLSANDKSRENPADTGAPVMAEQADGYR